MSSYPVLPRFDGASLVNLIASVEERLTGERQAPLLRADLDAAVPPAETYVIVLFDGLGAHQLDHDEASDLRAAHVAPIDAMFPTTTTVNLSTIATGLAPAAHGTIGHHMWIPEVGAVVNVLKWIIPGGQPVAFDTTRMLPVDNLWERLSLSGVEPITVQPGAFDRSPLSQALYRGCRIEPVWTERDMVAATTELAAERRRLIFTYVPHVDVAAHLFGQRSKQYSDAIRTANTIWRDIVRGLPAHAVAIGTADHGHLDYSPGDKTLVSERTATFFGDPRALFVNDGDAGSLVDGLPGRWYPGADILPWFGPGEKHPSLDDRLPAGVVLAD
ncbi:MAG: alkaline phosphatase family protein, partial [Acidimicrobiia bacterium]|nr:alkaline phosphatase family protein [Acidimicrobiia bacterium]